MRRQLGFGRRSDASGADLAIARALWADLLAQLERRGHGQRESGAFLLAAREAATRSRAGTVVAIAYYDDLDAHCLRGGISLAGAAYDALWTLCRTENLRVVADVHTHSGDWVGQSQIDQTNPMMAQVGHIAFVVGRYAHSKPKDPPVGMYRYLGSFAWVELDLPSHLRIDDPPRPRWWSVAWKRLKG